MMFPETLSISVLLLSVGEETKELALEALRAQDYPIQEFHLVEGVRPFSRAFNQGVEMVRSPFFIQCDADMILYPGAIAQLARGMAEDVCMVVGLLDDALQGAIQGVKLHRTEVARQNPHREECSCETAYLERTAAQGWRLNLYDTLDSLGEHRPTQEEAYTFGRFLDLGRKIRLRRDSGDVRMRLGRLADRWEMAAAPTAVAALCAGMCLDPAGDGPTRSCHFEIWRQSGNVEQIRQWLRNREWGNLLKGTGELLVQELDPVERMSRQGPILAALARQDDDGWSNLWTPGQ